MNKQVLLALSIFVVGVASSSAGVENLNALGLDGHRRVGVDWCNSNEDE